VHLSVPLDHAPPDLDCTPRRIHDASEFDQQAVPGGLHDPAAVLCNLGGNHCASMGLELGESPLLVSPHKPAVPDHIAGQDRCQLSLDGFARQGEPRCSIRKA